MTIHNQRFNQLSKDELHKGFYLCGESAHNHCDTAEVIVKEKKLYSIATSHLVLSVEEATKALIIVEKIKGRSIDKININKIFSKHLPKHEQVKKIFPNAKNLFIRFYYEYIEKNKDQILSSNNQDHILFKEITEIANFIEKLNKEKFDILWDKANKRKNSGFYVDYIKNDWIAPKDSINKNIYDKHYKIVRAYLFVVDIHNSLINN